MGKRINANTNLEKSQDVSIPFVAAKLHGLNGSSDDKENPSLNLKYYDYDFECFSCLSKEDLKSFSELCRKFRQLTWGQIKAQGGKKNKTGLAPTLIARNQLPKSQVLSKISDDIDFMELRLSKKSRVFGFRSATTFFLVFLDPNHKICK